ncbi:hypothetical protein [Paenibacillus silviterrae]|uniref:hypothetical protein n=1 Tax=Paenibacillus silviterrae TaxID=3242194 RepID=UPI0025427D10|nr:hypothetical protein [Paenibacillus chinjuensis]
MSQRAKGGLNRAADIAKGGLDKRFGGSVSAGGPQAVSAVAQRMEALQKALGNRGTAQLLAHQAAQRKKAAGGAASGTASLFLAPKSRQSSMPLQLKAAVMKSLVGAHMRAYTKDTDPSTSTDTYKVKEKEMKGPKIGFRAEFEDLGIADETGQWTLIKYGGDTGFVRKDKIGEKGGLSKARNVLAETKRSNGGKKMSEIGQAPEEESDRFDDITENISEGGELLMTGPGAASESIEETVDALEEAGGQEELKNKLETGGAGLGVASAPADAVLSGLGGLVAMKKMVGSLRDSNKSVGEKISDVTENSLDIGKAVQEGVEGTSGFIDDVGTLAGSDAVKAAGGVSDWSGSVGEAIDAIKSAFFTVKDVYDLFKKATSSEGISADEAIGGGLSAVKNGLSAAQGAVKTVKAILDILKIGSAGLAAAIPGIGIAISGITITIKVYDSIKAFISTYKMTKVKREFKDKYKARGADYVKENSLSVKGKTLWSSTGTDKDKLNTRKTDLEGNAGRSADEEQELQDIREYELAKEMKYINMKRLARAGIQSGLEMVNIAGEIATLSGVGAKVGIPLKAVAAGAGVSMSIARKAKQFGRDRAAKPGAWKVTKAVFNAEKSSANKQAKRVEQANLILDMIAKLPEYVPGDEGIKKQYTRVENFIASTGISPAQLYRLNGNVTKQREYLVSGMKKRE